MPVPNLDGFLAGEKVTAAKLTEHTKTALEEAVLFKPICHLTNTATQTFATGGPPLSVFLPTVVQDTDDMADPANNRIVVKTPGLYVFRAQIAWAINGTGYRFSNIYRNGATGQGVATTAGPSVAAVLLRHNYSSPPVRCNRNDTFAMSAVQTSGAALATDVTQGGVFLSAEWVAA